MVARVLPVLVLFLLGGCSTWNVDIRKASRPDGDSQALIEEAKRSLPLALSGNSTAMTRYNTAVEGLVRWLHSPTGSIPGVRLIKDGRGVLNPADYQSLTPASDVRIANIAERSATPGIGVPVVLWAPKGSKVLEGQPGIPPAGMTRAGTALLVFERGQPVLKILDPTELITVRLQGRSAPLASDFSAALAVLLSHGKNRSIDVEALLFTSRNLNKAGLIQLQPYDPNRVPVIFVHGLLSRAEAWAHATNHLMADPVIRKHYQFWYFTYPTGLPVWKSAAILRSEMNRFHSALDPKDQNPRLDRMVLVGHSMGGLISSLMVREGGEKLWRQFSDYPGESLKLTPQGRNMLRELIWFAPRRDVSRVIFVATPHQGSPMALRPIAGFAAGLIQLSLSPWMADRSEIVRALKDDMKSLFVAPANSIRFLRARSPFLMSILKLPLASNIPYHSIIGDRGKGNSPNSTDGVVPYWSSHLEGAVSEKIVPSGHGANENPEGIEEMRRILHEAALESSAAK